MALPAPGRDPWSLLGLLLSQLLLAVPLPLTAGGGGQEPMPRITYRAGEGHRALSLFHQKGLQDFDTLLLSDDGGTLYVGAREAILALDIQDPGMPKLKNMIPWPASDRKKSECAFKKKSNEVSGGRGVGTLGGEPPVPRPSLDGTWLGRQWRRLLS